MRPPIRVDGPCRIRSGRRLRSAERWPFLYLSQRGARRTPQGGSRGPRPHRIRAFRDCAYVQRRVIVSAPTLRDGLIYEMPRELFNINV